MTELHAENEKIMSHYRRHAAEYGRITDALSIPRFSRSTLDELAVLIGDDESLLVEAITRIGNFSDTNEISKGRKAVSKLLRADGVRLKRGKRTNPGLLEMIARLAPVLLYFGLPFASSERSKLVRALQLIAEEIGLKGDPRDEVRRLNKIKRVNEDATRKAVLDAFSRGLLPTTPPLISPSQGKR